MRRRRGCFVETPVLPVFVAVFEFVAVAGFVDTPVSSVLVASPEFVAVPVAVSSVASSPVSSSPSPLPERSSSSSDESVAFAPVVATASVLIHTSGTAISRSTANISAASRRPGDTAATAGPSSWRLR